MMMIIIMQPVPTSTLIISQIAEVWAWTHLPTTLDAQELYMRRCRHAAIKYWVPHMMYSWEKKTGWEHRKTRKSIILWGKVIFKTVIFMTHLPMTVYCLELFLYSVITLKQRKVCLKFDVSTFHFEKSYYWIFFFFSSNTQGFKTFSWCTSAVN